MPPKTKRWRTRKWLVAAACSAGTVVAVAFCLPFFIAGEAEARPQVFETGALETDTSLLARRSVGHLKVMTLNIAHGRKRCLNQVLQSRSTIRANLEDVAEVLRREKPHLLALQEADGVSLMSGRFDHVAFVARRAGFPRFVRGEHVKGLNMTYGTALLSQLPLSDPASVCFGPSPPTWPKGFVRTTVPWPDKRELAIDVVSVHLDFARASVRRRQIEALAAHLENRGKPLVVMGDFNCDWMGREPTLRWLTEELGLKAFRPEAQDIVTFPSLKKRLDWMLISDELAFKNCEVLQDEISDHLGVVAEIRLRESGVER
jgi:endonuclease/exonuclease/phosphatase family metal-dependent hydrolase